MGDLITDERRRQIGPKGLHTHTHADYTRMVILHLLVDLSTQ